MYVATERETSDNTEATRFSQCAHDQRRRLEAEDCNSIRCAQLISGGRRRIRPCPPRCLAHARPTMCCIRLVILYLISGRYKCVRVRSACIHACPSMHVHKVFNYYSGSPHIGMLCSRHLQYSLRIRGVSRSNARAVPLLHVESRRVSPACSREHIIEPIVGLSRPGCEWAR